MLDLVCSPQISRPAAECVNSFFYSTQVFDLFLQINGIIIMKTGDQLIGTIKSVRKSRGKISRMTNEIFLVP